MSDVSRTQAHRFAEDNGGRRGHQDCGAVGNGGMTLCSILVATSGTAMDYRTLETLRRRHPAWRLLVAEHAPLIVSFLHDTFIRPNVRTLSQPELVTRLDDYLFSLRAD